MQIALELRNGKDKIARFQTEVANGEKEFSKLVNSLSSIIFGSTSEPEIVTIEKIEVKHKNVTKRKAEIKPKKWEPEVINDEVVVPDTIEYKPKVAQKEIMLVAGCECGNTKVFRTLDNVGKTYYCDCGKEYPIENSILINATCHNCSHSAHGFRTLKGMDVSDFLTCKQCEAPIDLRYNEKSKQWNNI